MSENSKIEWTNHTFNPWWGCMKVSDGCKNCYAETLDNRYNHDHPHWGPDSPRKPMSEAYWNQPLKWESEAKASGIKARVFCASMADVFEDHKDVPEWRARLFLLISRTPNLIWQLLTKRPENILKFVPTHWLTQGWPENVWLGTTVENAKEADNRIPCLLKIPASIHFLSCEPLLGLVDLTKITATSKQLFDTDVELRETFSALDIEGQQGFEHCIDWVICGGESGHNARPMHPDWARSLRDQCVGAGVSFFFKQWGEYLPACQSWPDAQIKPKGYPSPNTPGKINTYYRVGKHTAGSVLDGHEWKEFPKL